MNGVRKEWLGSVLAEEIDAALRPLREFLDETKSRLSVVESGIQAAAAGQEARVAAARSRTGAAVDELKRRAGIRVDGDVTTLGGTLDC